MAWTFKQSTGELLDPLGSVVATGYSGMGIGKDNPQMEDVKNVGPIPVGWYRIGVARDHTKLGPMAMPLFAIRDTQEFGRDGFWIHADSLSHPGQASEGCIVMPGTARESINNSEDKTLEVVA